MSKTKTKTDGITSKIIGHKLPKTKTVWGLTKEEIEFCAYLFQGLSLVIGITGLVYVAIALKQAISVKEFTTKLTILSILFVVLLVPMVFGFYGIHYENRISLIIFAILDVFCIVVLLLATINWEFLVYGAVIIEVSLVLQLVIAVMLIMCLMAHNEIFKKEIPNWMDKPIDQKSIGLGEDPSEVYGSNLDIEKTKDQKQNDEKVGQNGKQDNMNDSKSQESLKIGSELQSVRSQTEGSVTPSETVGQQPIDNTGEQNGQKTPK